MLDKQPLRVEILAARLRVTLDKRLGRITPQHVVDLAKQTIYQGERYPPDGDRE